MIFCMPIFLTHKIVLCYSLYFSLGTLFLSSFHSAIWTLIEGLHSAPQCIPEHLAYQLPQAMDLQMPLLPAPPCNLSLHFFLGTVRISLSSITHLQTFLLPRPVPAEDREEAGAEGTRKKVVWAEYWGDKRGPEHAGPSLLAMAKILVFILRTRGKPLNKTKART